jgi:phage gp36-like protein
MSYTTKEEIIAFFDSDEVQDVTTERMNLIISSVDERINNAVIRFLPFGENIPTIINMIAVDIARYDIVADGRIYDEIKLNGLYRRYKNALSLLDAIKNGSFDLNHLNSDNLDIGIIGASFSSEIKRSYDLF